jgi:O-antigen/teichoic acid export membrane protein
MTKGIGSEIKLLSKHSGIYSLSNILNRFLAFLLLPLYLNYLTPADYAVKELLVYTMAFVGIVLEMGITAAVGRFYFDSEDQKERNLAVTSALYGFGVGSSLLILLLIFGSRFLTELVFKSPEHTDLMMYALAGLGLDMYINVAFTYMRVRHRSLTLMIVSLVRLLMQICMNVLFIVTFSMGVKGILLSTLIANSVLVLYLMPYILRETGFGFSWPKLKEMIRFGLPLIPSSFMSYIVNVSDRFFVNHMHGLVITGLYTLGYRFGVLINDLVSGPFAQIWTPRRFEMHQKDDSEKVFAQIFTYFCFAMFVVGLGISVCIQDLIQFVAEESYWEAWVVVPPLTLAYIISSFQMHFSVGILMKKKTKYLMYVNVSTALLNLILNYFLILEWGMWGAVYATIASFVVKQWVIYWVSNRLIPIEVEWGRVLKVSFVAIAMYWPITQVDIGHSILNMLAKGTLSLTLPLVLYPMGFYRPGEIRKGLEAGRAVLGKFIPSLRQQT